MTKYELLNAAKSMLAMMEENHIEVRDVKYLEMYREYVRLKNEGHKVSYVVYYLSTQYECGEATVYRVIKKMRETIK